LIMYTVKKGVARFREKVQQALKMSRRLKLRLEKGWRSNLKKLAPARERAYCKALCSLLCSLLWIIVNVYELVFNVRRLKHFSGKGNGGWHYFFWIVYP